MRFDLRDSEGEYDSLIQGEKQSLGLGSLQKGCIKRRGQRHRGILGIVKVAEQGKE
jgi:hypothetical protein